MLQQERMERIVAELASSGAVKVAQLASALHVSESTIRRDICMLNDSGRLKKVFGGAVALQPHIKTVEEDIADRAETRVQEKLCIARYAAAFITDEDFVFIDAGSTTENMIDFLQAKRAVYVTNGLTHGRKLAQRGFRLYMSGGRLKGATLSLIGAEAMDFIRRCNFTKCFMGADGVDTLRGYSTPDIDEAQFKTEVLRHSRQAYILADSSKFGVISAVTFGRIEEATIITDRLADDAFRRLTVINEAEGTDTVCTADRLHRTNSVPLHGKGSRREK